MADKTEGGKEGCSDDTKRVARFVLTLAEVISIRGGVHERGGGGSTRSDSEYYERSDGMAASDSSAWRAFRISDAAC